MTSDTTQFTVLLARQRSGTHALKSVLERHPAIFPTREIFHRTPREPARAVNYFLFIDRQPEPPEDKERLLLDHLAYVRGLTPKPRVILDIKYHQVETPFEPRPGVPRLIEFIREQGFGLLHLTRRNYLRYYVSKQKAERGDGWAVKDDTPAVVNDTRIELDVDDLLRTLERCREEDEQVASWFDDYDPFLSLDYEELAEGLGGPLAADPLERIARWLGVEPDFPDRQPELRKQATLPLEKSVMNYDEVERALRDTQFAYCLTDEPVYRTPG